MGEIAFPERSGKAPGGDTEVSAGRSFRHGILECRMPKVFPRLGWRRVPVNGYIRELWASRELLANLTMREIKGRYREPSWDSSGR